MTVFSRNFWVLKRGEGGGDNYYKKKLKLEGMFTFLLCVLKLKVGNILLPVPPIKAAGREALFV